MTKYYDENRVKVLDNYKKLREIKEYRLKFMFCSSRSRARLKNLEFNLDLKYLFNLWDEQDGRCAVSNRKFKLTIDSEDRREKDAPSLDRIDSKIGYLKGNVRLVTLHTNLALSTFGLDAFYQLCEDVLYFNKGMQ